MIVGNDKNKGRSRPKLTLDAVVRNDMIEYLRYDLIESQ